MLFENKDHFKKLFDRYYGELCSTAFSILKNQEEAEDIVQNFFLKIWDNRAHIEIVYSFRTYSNKAVYLLSLNRIRQQSRHLAIVDLDTLDDVVSPTLDSGIIKHREEEYNNLLKDIQDIIAQLPSKCQLIFKMAHFEQMKHAAIADQLGISINTVKVQMGRAYKAIRAQLKAKDIPYFVILFAMQHL